MSSVSRFSWFAASMFVVVVLACGVTLTGCGPAPSSDAPAVTTPESEPAVEPEPEPAVEPEPEPVAEPMTEQEPVVEPMPEPEPVVESEPEPVVEPMPEPEPVVEPEPEPEPAVEPAAASGDVKVSSFAPAADLVGQVDYYLERLAESVETEDAYAEDQDKIAKDSNTIVILALVLGLHDEDNQYKAVAPGLLKAAQKLAATTDYASAKEATAAVVAAASTPSEGELKWEKVASLPEMMKQVPLVNTKLKRYASRNRHDDVVEYSALIAAIAHGTLENADETEEPTEVDKWKAFSISMRDAAGAVNAAAHAEDEEAVTAAMEKLAVSCEDCHAVFHKETEEEAEMAAE
ncbi:MAG TPA: hypothetical protein VE890_05345 [Thermoguttaceae bacterium]|nr:hypothetical protein [Thermoguttaceae bacterium]